MTRKTFLQLSLLLPVCLICAFLASGQTRPDVPSQSEQYRRICQLISEKKFDQAIEKSKELIERAPEHEHAYAKLFQAARADGKLDEIKAWFESLTRGTPPNFRAYYGIALIDSVRGDPESAVENYRKCAERLPDAAIPLLTLISVWWNSGKVAEAEAYLKTLLEAKPDNPVPYVGLGYLLMKKGKTDEAVKALDQALSLNPRLTDACYYKMYALYNDNRNFESAEAGGKCLPVFDTDPDEERLKQYLVFLGAANRRTGNYQEAIGQFERARQLAQKFADFITIANISSQMASAFLNQGNYQKALDHYQLGFVLATENRNSSYASRLKSDAGYVYYLLGDYPRAYEYYQTALNLAKESGDLISRANTLLNLGRMLEDEKLPDRAASFKITEQSLASLKTEGVPGNVLAKLQRIKDQEVMGKERFLDRLRTTIGGMQTVKFKSSILKHANQAIVYYEQGLELAVKGNNPALQSTILGSLGNLYVTKYGNYQKGKEALQQALKLAEGKHPELEATSLNYIGNLRLRQNEPQLSTDSYLKALQVAERIDSPHNIWTAHKGLADAYALISRPDLAKPHYEKAIREIESVRAKLNDEEEKAGFISNNFEVSEKLINLLEKKAGFFGNKIEVYKKLINLLMELPGQDATNPYHAEAFNYAERARARAFLDLLAEAIDEQRLDPDLQVRRQEFKSHILRLTTQLTKEKSQAAPNQAEVGRLEAALRKALEDYSNWLREARHRNPRYADLKYPEPVGLDQAKKLLDDNSLLLAYSLGEQASFLFAVSRNEPLLVAKLPPEPLIRKRVNKLITAITDDGNRYSPKEYRNQAMRLYKELLQPAARMMAGKRELIIVPDGALHWLPFEALLHPSAVNISDLTSLPYLIKNHAISYAPSASVLSELRDHRRDSIPQKFFLAFAPIYNSQGQELAFAGPVYRSQGQEKVGQIVTRGFSGDGKRPKLPELKNSAREVKKIAGRFQKGETDLFLGKDANEENVKTPGRLGQYRMIHFAAHGLINDDRPRFSSIALSPPQAVAGQLVPETEDGLLMAYEIFNLKLKADLVALPACETGLGREINGEGLMSLARAFIYAGTSSVLATLWKVDDESSADLMIDFYRNLTRGRMSKAEALRRAQLVAIQKRRLPRIWAPFILVGKS